MECDIILSAGKLVMFRRALTIRPSAWVILGLALSIATISLVGPGLHVVSGQTFIYVVEPILALVLFGVSYYYAHGIGDRVRHKADKAFLVGSVVAVWFVLYFASGFFLTYQHNAVAANARAIVMNVLAFGISAIAFEYARHSVMVLGGRRNVVWLGVVTSLVFAISQIGLLQIGQLESAVDLVKLLVSNIIPSIAGSFLLTYLSFNAGLPAQLTYRLGALFAALVPPIIPKFDWYLTGISAFLLAICIYLAIDRTRGESDDRRSHVRRAKRTGDVMFVIVMVVLVMFMTGFFSYKPQAILSDSMKPVFTRGSMVVVQKVKPMDVSVGDIVQYDTSGHSITHRVVRIDAEGDGSGQRIFITKGDNSPSEDQPVHASQIVGVIRATVPYVGYPTVWLREITH